MKKDLEQEYRRCLTGINWIAYFLLILLFYKISRPFLQTMNLQLQLVDQFVVKFDQSFHPFSDKWLFKPFILFLFLIPKFAAVKHYVGRISKIDIIKGFAFCFVGHIFFYGSSYLTIHESFLLLLYMSLTTIGIFLVTRSVQILIPLLRKADDADRNDSSDWGKGPDDLPDPVPPRVGRMRQRFYVTHK